MLSVLLWTGPLTTNGRLKSCHVRNFRQLFLWLESSNLPLHCLWSITRLVVKILSSFFSLVGQSTWQFKAGRISFSSQFKATVHQDSKVMAASHIASTIRKQWARNPTLSLLFQPGPWPVEWCNSYWWWVFLSQWMQSRNYRPDTFKSLFPWWF